MKVSPEYFIQLSHRVNTLHREKKNLLKGQVEKRLLRAQVKRDKETL